MNQMGIANSTKLSAIKLSLGASINGVVHKNKATIQNRIGVDNQTRYGRLRSGSVYLNIISERTAKK